MGGGKKIVIFFIDGKTIHGGLSDRLRGLFSTYYYCLKEGIDFKVFWTYPFNLQDYLEPNKVNWLIEGKAISHNKNEVAFRFSKKLGVVANNDLAGTPFYISLKDLKSVKIPQEDGKKKKDLDGIAYNVPGQAMVTLTDGKKKLYEGELPITQFGVIEYLAPVLFNKNSTIKVYFDPNTGGLLKVDREEGK